MTDLAVIIITWNTRDLVLNTLRSLFADLNECELDVEVHVLDNASSDGTVEAIAAEFPQVELIASPGNLGFAGGNNHVMRKIGFGQLVEFDLPKAVYLLNSDTVTQIGATQQLYDALMSKGRVGLVGARLAYGDGSFQDSAFAFPGLRQLWVELFPTPGRLIQGEFNGRYPRWLYATGQPFPVDFVLGATMMLRQEVIQQTGIFDEQFFMYCEEIDWAWRIREAGWQVRCVPTARVTHLSGQSTGQIRSRSVIDLWTSRLRLYTKHYPPWKFRIARRMVALGMRLKINETNQIRGLTLPERMALIGAYQTIHDMAST